LFTLFAYLSRNKPATNGVQLASLVGQPEYDRQRLAKRLDAVVRMCVKHVIQADSRCNGWTKEETDAVWSDFYPVMVEQMKVQFLKQEGVCWYSHLLIGVLSGALRASIELLDNDFAHMSVVLGDYGCLRWSCPTVCGLGSSSRALATTCAPTVP
jgi:hypothetical protein